MDFRLLGPVEVRHADRLVDAGHARQRAVLAALAVDTGSPVPMDALIDRVWDTAPPSHARHQLYSYVARIRRVISSGDSAATIVRRSGGYQLDVDPSQVDLFRWRAHLRQARRPGVSVAEQAERLGQALQLWRGAPLSDLNGSWADRVRDGWHLHRIEAGGWWAETQLRLGRPELAIGPTSVLVAEYPLVESLTGVLLRALAMAGRGAEALNRYAALRQLLADTLGVDPSPELQVVHRLILRGEPVTPGLESARQPGERTAPEHPRVPPSQLPMPVPRFVGRAAALSRLDRAAAGAVAGRSVALIVLSGTAGVGKTALAVHWAHRIRARFPDGQLAANLRAFRPAEPAPSIEAVLHSFLVALGQPPASVPVGLEARSALYRTLLTGRRVLVLLDDAADAADVRPLLPAAPGCAVLVTSRHQLTGLVAAEAATPVHLDMLPHADAVRLFRHRLGAGRTVDDGTARRIVARCGRLPLAVVVAAARAAARTGVPIADLADELGDERLLDTLTTGDAGTDVRAAFAASYDGLAPATARLFRTLGQQPDPEVSLATAASLVGLPPARAAPLLADLARAHLVAERARGRYELHPLWRAYAADRANRADPD